MSYLYDIKVAAGVFPLLALLFTLPYMLHEYRKYGALHLPKVGVIYSFIFYLLCCYFLVIFPLPSTKQAAHGYMEMLQTVPFQFIKDLVEYNPIIWNDPSTYARAITHHTFLVPVWNIVMFMPLGMYLRYYYKKDIGDTLAIGLSLSLFFELTQWTGLYFIYDGPYRLCDIDDLIQNTAGALAGFALVKPFLKVLPTREQLDDKAYEKGKKVSQIRYFFGFLIDLGIIVIASIIPEGNTGLYFLLIFTAYHTVLPLIKGLTIGGFLLKYRVTYKEHRILRTIARGILMTLSYFLTPAMFILVMEYAETMNEEVITMLFLFLAGSMLINLLIIIGIILTNRTHLYDKITKAEYVSLVKKRL